MLELHLPVQSGSSFYNGFDAAQSGATRSLCAVVPRESGTIVLQESDVQARSLAFAMGLGFWLFLIALAQVCCAQELSSALAQYYSQECSQSLSCTACGFSTCVIFTGNVSEAKCLAVRDQSAVTVRHDALTNGDAVCLLPFAVPGGCGDIESSQPHCSKCSLAMPGRLAFSTVRFDDMAAGQACQVSLTLVFG